MRSSEAHLYNQSTSCRRYLLIEFIFFIYSPSVLETFTRHPVICYWNVFVCLLCYTHSLLVLDDQILCPKSCNMAALNTERLRRRKDRTPLTILIIESTNHNRLMSRPFQSQFILSIIRILWWFNRFNINCLFHHSIPLCPFWWHTTKTTSIRNLIKVIPGI